MLYVAYRYQQVATAAFKAKHHQQQQQQQQQPALQQQPLHTPQQQHGPEHPSLLQQHPSAAIAPTGVAPLQPISAASSSNAAASSTSSSGVVQGLESVAHELYRVLFFLIFYVEVLTISYLPYIGKRG